MRANEGLFEDDATGLAMYRFFEDFVRKTGRTPTLEGLREQFKSFLPPEAADPEILLNELQERRIKRTMALATNELAQSIHTNPRAAMVRIADVLGKLMAEMNAPESYDFKNAIETGWPWLIEKWTQKKVAVPLYLSTLQEMTGGIYGGEVVSTIGRPGLGKAQPLTSLILMADGRWSMMGNLKVGDKLASVDGERSVVEAIYPQGMRPVYEVEMADGRVVKADAEHLWEVHSSKWDAARTLTTLEIASALDKVRYSGRLAVPALVGEFGVAPIAPDAYVLGLLVGDGCFRSRDVRLTSADGDIVAAVKERLPAGHGVTSNGIEHRITSGGGPNQFKQWLEDVGLWGGLSTEKFIPPEVFRWRRWERVDFLRGLFDSDGWCSGGVTEFGSSSFELAKGVQQLCWSLGMTASLNTGSNNSWRVNVMRDGGLCPFRLPRKAVRHQAIERQQKQNLVKIVAVRPVDDEECQCIKVSHPRALYVTDGYIVTHNTWTLIAQAMFAWAVLKRPVLFVSMEIMVRKLMERLMALYTLTAMDWFKHGDHVTIFGESKREKVKGALVALAHSDMPPFVLVDGNLSAKVDDVVALTQAHNPCAVFVDGAYLMKIPGRVSKGYEKIEQITEGLKGALATAQDVPVFTSWQFNREAEKARDGTPSLAHIAGGDSVGQISSLVLGLVDDPAVTDGSPEYTNRRKIHILKGRDGETGELYLNWDFRKMDFNERGSNTYKDKDLLPDVY